MIVLKQHIQPHEVHLLEVGVGNPVVDVMLGDEGHKLAEESFFLFLLYRTPLQFLID